MKSSQLMKLFVDQLKDIYWAEKAADEKLSKVATEIINIEAAKEEA